MNIFLLRHGEAADRAPDGTRNDDLRELTTEGTEKLRSACSAYARLIGTPGKIVHSPLRRARQSAEILAEIALDGRLDEMIEMDELRPGGRATQIVDMLQSEFIGGCESVVLVGHEPLLGDLLGVLTSGNDRFSLPMGKGMLAAVRMTEPQVMIGRLMTMMSQASALRMG
jgi:phosphohistidine phosphatase